MKKCHPQGKGNITPEVREMIPLKISRILFFKDLFYLFEREGSHAGVGGAVGEGESQADSALCIHGAQLQA